jgi:hypothetical protein
MVAASFIATQTAGGDERIELVEERPGGFLRRAATRRIARTEWVRHAPPAGLAALSAARALSGAEDLVEDEDGMVLPASVVAALGELEARALGLPPVTPLTLQLHSRGSLAEGSIEVHTRWLRRGGSPVRADVAGARVREGDRSGRLVDPLRTAALLSLQVNAAASGDDRRAAFAAFRDALGPQIAEGIEADGFIERIRIAYAANFSLDAKTSGARFDFDPVLFGRHVRETVEGDLVDASEASLLTPQESLQFQHRFRTQDGARRSYLMADGTLLFVDPLLGRALQLVREKQKGSSDERRDFLRAPQRHLREALGLDNSGDDSAADLLFIETRQFSERVNGIEVWRLPVLPWIKPKPNSWLPEAFGIRVGEAPDDRFVELEPGEANKLVDAVDTAIGRGDEHVVWKNDKLPATPATRRAAVAVAAMEREAAAAIGDGSATSDEPSEALQTFFLQVGQNFETLDYARLPRASVEPDFIAPKLPAGIVSVPKLHQQAAFEWASEAFSRKMPGLLLADDMGLGKTFQALIFLRWLRAEAAPGRPILIIAPTGLLRNWQAEIALHLAPGALGRVIEAFGSELRMFRTGPGNDIRGGTTRLDVEAWDEAGIVLTTYETMRDYHMSFARLRFSAIVFDEAQKLKNPASQMTRAAKALNADLQLAMTGTPVENRLQDLWSIADIVYPGFLGSSREFEATYPATDRSALMRLQALLVEREAGLPPFMLRRMKDEILTGLPKKMSRSYAVTMPPTQAAAYDEVLARARALRQSGEKGAMLKVLHMLRGRSLHPYPPRGISDFDAYVAQSARLSKTFEILADVKAAGEKALVFCEDLEMQSFLAVALQARFHLKRTPVCISGEVPGPRRQELVQAFQSAPPGFDVMILSPKAGGVGLTITAANHVIHLSRWWNPAVEDQATDRAYRIGQSREVTVHLPIATHPDPAIGPFSFDHRLDELMARKRALSRGLLVPPENERDVEELLSSVLDGDSPGQAFSPPSQVPDAEGDSGSGLDAEVEAAATSFLQVEADVGVTPEPASGSTRDRQASDDRPDDSQAAKAAEVEDAAERDDTFTAGEGENTPIGAEAALSNADELARDDSGAAEGAIEAKTPVGATAPHGATPPTTRPVLSARPTPIEAAEARAPSIRRIEFEPFKIRDWAIFDQYLVGAMISRLRIQDPYCCADTAARDRLVQFVRHFWQKAERIERVEVVAFDADSLSARVVETNSEQRTELEQRWRKTLSSLPLTFLQRSRRAQGDLHDRFIQAHLDDGDHIIWDLGRGIDGIMSARFGCIVNASYEKLESRQHG